MNQKIVVIGSGNVSRALVTGWLERAPQLDIAVLARSDRYLTNGWTRNLQNLVTFETDVLSHAHVIVLAVKPKNALDVLDTVKMVVPSRAPIISVVAGVTISQIETVLGAHSIVRTMPNICSAVGHSVTGATFSRVSSEDKERIMHILQSLGRVVETPEHLLDPMTALYGSGPAYVYVFFEAIVEAAIRLGLPEPLARELTIDMVLGSSKLAAAEKDAPLNDLIKQVVSPGGTTEAMLNVLHQNAWPAIMRQALFEAGDRARKLGQSADNTVPAARG